MMMQMGGTPNMDNSMPSNLGMNNNITTRRQLSRPISASSTMGFHMPHNTENHKTVNG